MGKINFKKSKGMMRDQTKHERGRTDGKHKEI